MTAHHLVAVGSEEVIRALPENVSAEEVRFGPPRALDSYSDAVDAPLGPEEVKLVFEAINLAVQSAANLTLLVLAIRTLLSKRPPGEAVVLKHARTGRQIIVVERETDPEEVARKILEDLQ